MSDRPNLRFAKHKYLFGVILLLLTVVICVAFGITGSYDFDIARREVLLRRIGHELLLQSGDSVSRVLPVKKTGENDYRISFENALTFQPDSLVNTTQRLLAKDPLAGDYVVNMLNCRNASVAYGFAISSHKKDDIVACRGRIQPTACYMMDIKFKPTNIITVKKVSLLGSLSVLAFVGFIFLRSARPRRALPHNQQAGMFMLGSISFDAVAQRLMIHEKTIDLTGTETRVLRIFASSPNEPIERSRLQKEIWEDEGVIVGRSLDMFISKLRKKLEPDPNVKIVVIRGKGYKLEISA
ncbi:winged helix-turn-helix domain-containing protein [Niabella sp. CC-SYL272]|uniref:winged helix-turn-helix domain-containing protein n=1 Tax=Niabella agricola TaxID=2891571 RepID=UPI001F4341F9|nr:winged helix-turn-helix domain-containing protein [Niabella agricola]MCF3112018.1 winged helix-turn-helix domain-containing protein [Niabella agricola]